MVDRESIGQTESIELDRARSIELRSRAIDLESSRPIGGRTGGIDRAADRVSRI
jgi:hypothetical protein